MKKWILGVLVSVLAVLLFVSAGQQESSRTRAAKKLTFGIALGENEWEVMRKFVFPLYTKKTGITIEGVQIESADIEVKLESLKGKGEIDVIAPDNMLLYGLVRKGLVKDLSSLASTIPPEVDKANYEFYKINGKMYFLPFRPNVKINLYNAAKFNAAGLTPPRNWDELLNVAKKFHESDRIGRIGMQAILDAATTIEVFEFVKSAGGDPLILNDEGSIKAFTFLKELWPYVSRESLRANFAIINQVIATDAVYYASNWPFAVNVIVEDGQKKEIKAHAGFTGPVKMNKVVGGNVLAISADTTREADAIDFCRFLASKEVQEILVSKLGWPACRNDAYGSVTEWQKPYFAAVMEALKNAEPRPVVSYWADVDKACIDAFKSIVIDGGDVKSNLDRYAAIIAAARARAQ